MSNRSGGYVGHVNQNQAHPEIQVIKLHKSTNGMGLSIVAAKVRTFIPYVFISYDLIMLYIFFSGLQGAGQDRLGIYIKSVVAGGAADAVSNTPLYFRPLFIKLSLTNQLIIA